MFSFNFFFVHSEWSRQDGELKWHEIKWGNANSNLRKTKNIGANRLTGNQIYG
jgi:hypothetical protein